MRIPIQKPLSSEDKKKLLTLTKTIFPSYNRWEMNDNNELVAYLNAGDKHPSIEGIPWFEFTINVLAVRMYKGNKYYRRGFSSVIGHNKDIIGYLFTQYANALSTKYKYK